MGLTSKLGLQPLESPSLVAERKGSLDIGILKSTSSEEKRVVLTPRNVEIDADLKVDLDTPQQAYNV